MFFCTQVVKFITTDYENAIKRRRVVRRLEHGPIPSKGVDTWVNEGIVIPPLPPMDLKNCRIIKISYVLEVGKCFTLLLLCINPLRMA